MNRLSVSAYGVEEIRSADLRSVNGWFKLLIPRVIIRVYTNSLKTLKEAYNDIKAEGGVTCCDMPFK